MQGNKKVRRCGKLGFTTFFVQFFKSFILVRLKVLVRNIATITVCEKARITKELLRSVFIDQRSLHFYSRFLAGTWSHH